MKDAVSDILIMPTKEIAMVYVISFIIGAYVAALSERAKINTWHAIVIFIAGFATCFIAAWSSK